MKRLIRIKVSKMMKIMRKMTIDESLAETASTMSNQLSRVNNYRQQQQKEGKGRKRTCQSAIVGRERMSEWMENALRETNKQKRWRLWEGWQWEDHRGNWRKHQGREGGRKRRRNGQRKGDEGMDARKEERKKERNDRIEWNGWKRSSLLAGPLLLFGLFLDSRLFLLWLSGTWDIYSFR